MWSSSRVLILSAAAASAFAALSAASPLFAALLLVAALQISAVALSAILYAVRPCPPGSRIAFGPSRRGDRWAIPSGHGILTGSGRSSSVYVVRGTVLLPHPFLYPLLLCAFTYFKPLRIEGGEYLAVGRGPGFAYSLKSVLGRGLSEGDVLEAESAMLSILCRSSSDPRGRPPCSRPPACLSVELGNLSASPGPPPPEGSVPLGLYGG